LATERIIAALNEDISYELGAIMQYLWHHFTAEGLESPAIIELFKETSLDEMKHLSMLAERVVYLGGEPTAKIAPFKQGGDLRQMVQDDLEGERTAIRMYREHIRLCEEEGDPVTRLMLENILSDEEKHADRWETVLAVRKKPS
jgi:bacterioferritin